LGRSRSTPKATGVGLSLCVTSIIKLERPASPERDVHWPFSFIDIHRNQLIKIDAQAAVLGGKEGVESIDTLNN